MVSFSQWYTGFTKEPKIKTVTWLYGSEEILIQDVADRIKNFVKPDPWNLLVLDAAESTERHIWSEIRQLPFGIGTERLAIVWNAEKLTGENIIHYLADRRFFPANKVVFVSREADVPKVLDEETKREVPVPFIEEIRKKGQLIQCRQFTENTAKYAVRWVMESARINSTNAAHLLNRANGDLRLVRDVIAKLKVFPADVTLATINTMLAERPKDTFINSLFALDRKTALKALNEMPRSEWSRTLGLLDARLELAGYVHDQQVQHKSPGEIARGAGNKSFLVPDMLPVAKYYDIKRRQKIRGLLSLIDEYTTTGIPNGAFEVLVAFW